MDSSLGRLVCMEIRDPFENGREKLALKEFGSQTIVSHCFEGLLDVHEGNDGWVVYGIVLPEKCDDLERLAIHVIFRTDPGLE